MRRVFGIFFIGLFQSLFNSSTKYALAFRKQIGTSFLIQEAHRYQYKTILSRIKDFLKAPIVANEKKIKSDFIVLDVNNFSKQNRLEYLENYSKTYSNLYFVSTESLMVFRSISHKFLVIISVLPIIIVQLILGLFLKDKSGLSSLLHNCLINSNLLNSIDSSSTPSFFIFSIYDTNSAFLSLCLMNNGFHVTNITSEVPLYKWNKIAICHTLHVCSKYQLAELKHISTLMYNKVELGMPEKSYAVKQLYTNQEGKDTHQLGFISTGGWVRNKLGHINQGTSIEENEAKILADLNEILSTNSFIKLIIYPHPRELTYYSSIEELVKHYNHFLPTTNFEIKQTEKATNELFDETKLSICYLSTIIFERAYFKRASAIVYFKDDIFPVVFEDEYLYMIDSKEKLKQLIIKTYQTN